VWRTCRVIPGCPSSAAAMNLDMEAGTGSGLANSCKDNPDIFFYFPLIHCVRSQLKPFFRVKIYIFTANPERRSRLDYY
jgi:hypothetical protein